MITGTMTGGHQCPTCGMWSMYGQAHICGGSWPPASNIPLTNPSITFTPLPANVGWKCPVCGSGIAPWQSRCPHDAGTVTANTTTPATP